MRNRSRIICWVIISVMASALLGGVHAAGQTRPAKGQAPVTAPAAPAPTEKDIAALQDQFIKLLRQSPKLTSVVARDPSLLSNREYVTANNPPLADFLALHPEVALNPDYYLFSKLKHEDGGTEEALERETWPDLYRARPERTAWDEVVSDLPPTLAAGAFLLAFLWVLRLFVESRRWSRIFTLQNQVHGKLIDKFSTNQELAAYMETEAGRRFLEAAPIPVNLGTEQRVPNAVARVMTPVQIGVVLVLLGIAFLSLRHAGPDMDTPMRVLGTVILMPGIGFIISAGITWLLATRLGLMPPPNSTPANKFEPPFGNSDRS